MVCEGKPDMENFFNPITSELKKLLEIVVNNNDLTQLYKFFLLAGTFDKPARAKVLNITNSTGNYVCLKCRQRGIEVTYNRGHHHIFPFIDSDPTGPFIELFN